MDYLKFANSWIMWIAVIPAIALTVVQAVVFTKRALSVGKEIGITKQEFKRAAVAATTASIGPAVVVATGCVALIVAIGGPMSWMRLAYIGSVAYELITAQLAATTAGATLGGAGMNISIFCTCLWVMTIACLGWILVSALFTDKMDKLTDFVSKGNSAKIGIITTGALLGAYGYLATNQCLSSKSISGAFFALLVAAAVQAFFILFGRKRDVKWMAVWGMTISMFSGLLAAALYI
ncbi:MAG: DUF5058 family protein [Oscillospiraceae bacterium]